jgi:hypothetical protein
VAALLALLPLLLVPAPRASACSCIGGTPEHYFQEADLVFFARAGGEKTTGNIVVQPLEVLRSLKGRPGRIYQLSRPASARGMCSRTYKRGEIALVFITKGEASVCGGNYDLEAVHLEKMGEYLKLGRPAPLAADLPGVRAALETGLRRYLHARPLVPVTWAPLAGRMAHVGKSSLSFIRHRLKHAVELRHALASGPVIYVEGYYGLEGFAFRTLILHRGRDRAGKDIYETLATWGAERKR